MAIRCGTLRTSLRAARASSISLRVTSGRPRVLRIDRDSSSDPSARHPSMSEAGNGHGWRRRTTAPTRIPASSSPRAARPPPPTRRLMNPRAPIEGAGNAPGTTSNARANPPTCHHTMTRDRVVGKLRPAGNAYASSTCERASRPRRLRSGWRSCQRQASGLSRHRGIDAGGWGQRCEFPGTPLLSNASRKSAAGSGTAETSPDALGASSPEIGSPARPSHPRPRPRERGRVLRKLPAPRRLGPGTTSAVPGGAHPLGRSCRHRDFRCRRGGSGAARGKGVGKPRRVAALVSGPVKGIPASDDRIHLLALRESSNAAGPASVPTPAASGGCCPLRPVGAAARPPLRGPPARESGVRPGTARSRTVSGSPVVPRPPPPEHPLSAVPNMSGPFADPRHDQNCR